MNTRAQRVHLAAAIIVASAIASVMPSLSARAAQPAGGGANAGTNPAGRPPAAAAPAAPAARSSPSEPPRAGSAEIAIATVMPFDVTTTATGELEAARQVEIRNPLEQPTTITEIVREGSRVSAGDVLVRLNSEQIERQLSEEQLRVETARADVAVGENQVAIQISDNESSIRQATLDVEVAKLELRQWLEGDVKSRRQSLDLALDRANREVTRLKDRFERAKTLAAEGFLSTDELKRDELAYLEAEANLKTAELNKRVYEDIQFGKDEKIKNSAVEEAQAKLDRVRRTGESQLSSRQAELANRREQLRLREQNLAKLREQFAGAVIKAPIDGLVVYATSLNRDRWGGGNEAALDVGRQVTRNQSLIVLPDTSEMVASVRIHESLAGRVRQGMASTIRVDALGGRSINGQVLSVGVLAESGGWRDPNLREYTVKIKLDDSDYQQLLKPSMRAEAEILLDRVPATLTVPIQAVFTDGMVRYVLVPQGN
nr:HlyD family secretion protein [Phycisphaerales bacterium]